MMFSGSQSCLNPRLVRCISRPDQPLSSYHIDVLASRLSPHTRTPDVLIPRQLAPIVGPAHGGVEFLKGALKGIRKFPSFWMKKVVKLWHGTITHDNLVQKDLEKSRNQG